MGGQTSSLHGDLIIKYSSIKKILLECKKKCRVVSIFRRLAFPRRQIRMIGITSHEVRTPKCSSPWCTVLVIPVDRVSYLRSSNRISIRLGSTACQTITARDDESVFPRDGGIAPAGSGCINPLFVDSIYSPHCKRNPPANPPQIR